MFLRFYLPLVLFGSSLIQCAFVQQYESQLLMQRFFTDIKKVAKFLFDSSDAKLHPDGSIISPQIVQPNNNVPSQSGDDTLLREMKEEFITRVHWDEQTRFDHHFFKEYRKKYDFYTDKISQFQNDADMNGDVLDVLLSLKFDAIMKTLRSMLINPEKTEEYGIFNEIFDIIRENDFIIDKKILKPLLNKIIEVMQCEQRRVDDEKKEQGIIFDFVRFFIADEDEEEQKEDNFEKIFVQYGLGQDDFLLYDKLIDERRYDFHVRRIEDVGRQGAYSME